MSEFADRWKYEGEEAAATVLVHTEVTARDVVALARGVAMVVVWVIPLLVSWFATFAVIAG